MKNLNSYISEKLNESKDDKKWYGDFEDWVTDTFEEWAAQWDEYEDEDDREDHKGEDMYHAAEWFEHRLDEFNKKYHHNLKWSDTLEDIVEDIKQNYI